MDADQNRVYRTYLFITSFQQMIASPFSLFRTNTERKAYFPFPEG